MYDQALFVRTLSDLARALLLPYDDKTVFHRLTGQVAGLLGLPGCAVSLLERGRLRFVAGTGAAAGGWETGPEIDRAGPHVDALSTGEVVLVPDLDRESRRWPRYAQAARAAGLAGVAAVPLRLEGPAVGVLELFRADRHPWPPEDIAAARLMSDLAAGHVMNASHHHRQVELNRQLQAALDSRIVIEQAKGMIAAREGLPPDHAFELLRRHARQHGSPLHDVAEAVVHLGLEIRR